MKDNLDFDVKGMTCSSCVSHVEKAVSKVNGVRNVNVSLLTNSMSVDFDSPADEEKICQAVSKAGYQATARNSQTGHRQTSAKDDSLKKMVTELIFSLIMVIPLFYLSMGYMMGWNIGSLSSMPLVLGMIELILSLSVMLINRHYYVSGIKALINREPNMDTLVSLGSLVSFIYSVGILILMAAYVMPSADQNSFNEIVKASMNLSFETSAMVPTLISVGKTLEYYSKGKTTDSIKMLLELTPKKANVIRNEKEIAIDVDEVKMDDVFIVRPGERFPVDGKVISGESSIDESALTGESLPVDKSKDSLVSSGTINQNGALTCLAIRVGNDTSIRRIAHLVETASSTKTKISRIADKVAGVFVPVVISVSLTVFICWMIFGSDFVSSGSVSQNETLLSYALERAISVLVISCPCALGLATPVAIMVANGLGARNGILFKTASVMEETGKADFAVFDKTGTLTKGRPEVTDIIPLGNTDKTEFLRIAASLEHDSEHPYAKAIAKKAQEEELDLKQCLDFKAVIGHGVQGKIDGKEGLAGNLAFIRNYISIDQDLIQKANDFSLKGKTPLFFLFDGSLIGMIAVADSLKEDSIEAIKQIKELGLVPIMLTGDNQVTAKAIASSVGIDVVYGSVLPQGKLEIIQELKKKGKVLMVGDGINDAPALTASDIGMAIGSGTDIAIESGDVVLMKNSLLDVASAIRLSRKTMKNIKENLFWAFFYNLIMIPIAAGVFSAVGLAKLKPWMSAASMSLSSLCVVLNALRLNLLNIYKPIISKKKPISLGEIITAEKSDNENIQKEDKKMLKTVFIEGMMCQMCVKHVKSALEKLESVTKAEVSLEEKKAVITSDSVLSDEAIRESVESSGYKVREIK
ncbi:MAG: heavy metal translocating P-type ATPase [Bacilli bacterium]